MVDSFRMKTHQNSSSAWTSPDACDADAGGASAGVGVVAVVVNGDACDAAGGSVGRPS